ncbi:hypothetical protein G9A89_023801 [Geosiphon pyriformis]|nr:hypothetical protein G9A89_023801 [Geosiphon pyriformis]
MHAKPLRSIPVENPFDRIGIDLVGPLSITSQRNCYITVAPEARAIQVADAKTVAKFRLLLSPYHSQMNRLVKQFNRTLCEALAKIIYERKAMLPIEQVIPSYPTETINEENFEATLYQRMYQLMETLENNRRTAAGNISHAQK